MNLFKNVDESWIPLLHSLAYKEPLIQFLTSLRDISFQPDIEQIFRVFEMPVKDIKMVLLGSDPYPTPRTSTGYAYAVDKEVEMPRMLAEVHAEIHGEYKNNPEELSESFLTLEDNQWKTLDHWRDQGVFLLNSALTVETGAAGSHIKYWKEFTEAVVSYISEQKPCIWMLLGKHALSHVGKIKNPLIVRGYDKETIKEIPVDPLINYIIPGAHPITRTMGDTTFTNNGFSSINTILEKRSLSKIKW